MVFCRTWWATALVVFLHWVARVGSRRVSIHIIRWIAHGWHHVGRRVTRRRHLGKGTGSCHMTGLVAMITQLPRTAATATEESGMKRYVYKWLELYVRFLSSWRLGRLGIARSRGRMRGETSGFLSVFLFVARLNWAQITEWILIGWK